MTQLKQTAEAYGYDRPKDHPTWGSASKIVPMLMEFVNPRSVIDIGCGVGIWLSAFRDAGVTDIRGIDGDWVQPEFLAIPKECFTPADLKSANQAVARVGRRFDLALSLEVAEHLPAESADEFVSALVSLSDVVCFSAAIPEQWGYRHINEQWQSYWAKKFNAKGYLAFDVIRPRILADNQVQPYYRQNIILYANTTAVSTCLRSALDRRIEPSLPEALDYVIPEYYLNRIGPRNFTLGVVFAELPAMFMRSARTRWHRFACRGDSRNRKPNMRDGD